MPEETRQTSPKQIEANRQNAKKSTGPRTKMGKDRVRLNAVTHGIYAAPQVLVGESKSEHRALTSSIVDALNPQGPIEWLYVSEIVGDMVRLKRINLTEYAYMNALFSDACKEIPLACDQWNLSVAMKMSIDDGVGEALQRRRRILLTDIQKKIEAFEALKQARP